MSGANDPLTLGQAVELATAHLQAGRLREAESLFRAVLAADPDNLSLLDTLGRITHQCGDYDQALDYFNHAIRLHPNDPGARFNRGVALEAQGRLEEAEAAYREVLSCDPRLALAHGNLGVVLHKQGRDDEALACFLRSLELNPRDPKTCNNLGLARRRLGEPQLALADFQRALQWAPDYAEAHNNLGVALSDLGRAAEADACYRQALRLKPDLARAQWNLAALLLLRGEFEEGLALYESRFTGGDEGEFTRPRQLFAELAAVPRWSGEPLQGRRLLIWAEQGAGDAVMMLRYLPRLAAKGAGAVIVSCRAGLRRLIGALPAVTRVMEDGDPLPLDAVDCHCPVMSLPHAFGTRLETIPGDAPYLSVPLDLAQRWRQRVAPLPGLKVGLAWAGNPALRDDRLRSIAFERLAPLLAVPGTQFISLQKEGGVSHPALRDWMTGCADFLDTAALIEQLDLVISVDTAVAHLAGALGKPIWLLNRSPSEWRWMEGREDSPWYPTLRIFRQPRQGDWDSVIARVAEALRAQTHTTLMEQGKGHYAAGRWAAAEAAFRTVMTIAPQSPDGHNAVGNVCLAQRRYQEAIACYRRAIELNPDSAKYHANLGIALQRLGDPETALSCQRRALELDSVSADIQNNLGSIYQELGRITEAEDCFLTALQRRPNFPLAQCNLAMTRLLQGDFTQGLALYENRFKAAEADQPAFSREAAARLAGTPRWQGEDLHGRSLFLWREQGLGDAIMMARYLPRLKERGAAGLIVSCHPALMRLLKTLPAVEAMVDDGDVPAHCDYQLPLMSLPYAFGTRLETIPHQVPYFAVPPAMTARWREQSAALPGLKVGLSWAGSRTQRKDNLRSIAFERLMPLLAVPGVQFISLQKEGGVSHPALGDWMAECEDFLDTAALIEQLDLVISVDTAVAHLAGALARPVWLLNRYESEWRWMLAREDSPWYPTLRIFRQPRRGDWDTVIAKVAAELRAIIPANSLSAQEPERRK